MTMKVPNKSTGCSRVAAPKAFGVSPLHLKSVEAVRADSPRKPSGLLRFGGGTRRAFSLIEVLVAVTLMSVIVLGLLAMFSEVQRAFRTGITQVDIMESGRSAIELISREIEHTVPTRRGVFPPANLSGGENFYAQNRRWNGAELGPLYQMLPGKVGGLDQLRTNLLQNVFCITRNNQDWQGVGYSVIFANVNSTSSVGTLCRFEANASALNPDDVANLGSTTFLMRSNRIADGVVHFRVLAYDARGGLLSPYSYNPASGPAIPTNQQHQFILNYNLTSPLSYDYWFRSNAVPAYVDIELGILEKKTVEKARGIAFNNTLPPWDPNQAQVRYISNQVGRVQIFRQRVSIRNVDPSVYQ